MRFDPELHSRRSARLRGYDYARAGAYFVTVCTAHREALLAAVDSGEVTLTEAGARVQSLWKGMSARFPSVELDAFVIMPDHMHAIVRLHGTRTDGTNPRPSLSQIMRAFKSITGIEVNRIRGMAGTPAWQARFYDRVLRDEEELERARRYIAENPARWSEGKDDTGRYGP